MMIHYLLWRKTNFDFPGLSIMMADPSLKERYAASQPSLQEDHTISYVWITCRLISSPAKKISKQV